MNIHYNGYNYGRRTDFQSIPIPFPFVYGMGMDWKAYRRLYSEPLSLGRALGGGWWGEEAPPKKPSAMEAVTVFLKHC